MRRAEVVQRMCLLGGSFHAMPFRGGPIRDVRAALESEAVPPSSQPRWCPIFSSPYNSISDFIHLCIADRRPTLHLSLRGFIQDAGSHYNLMAIARARRSDR